MPRQNCRLFISALNRCKHATPSYIFLLLTVMQPTFFDWRFVAFTSLFFPDHWYCRSLSWRSSNSLTRALSAANCLEVYMANVNIDSVSKAQQIKSEQERKSLLLGAFIDFTSAMIKVVDLKTNTFASKKRRADYELRGFQYISRGFPWIFWDIASLFDVDQFRICTNKIASC